MGTIQIDPDAPYFRGHFPERPILPGVVQLMLLVDHLSQEAGRPLTLRSIKFARLRQLVLPNDRLDVAAREGAGVFTRVDVKRDGVLVANAELELSTAVLEQRSVRPRPIEGVPVAAPPLDLLLPHRPPMRFVTGLEREMDGGLQCTACVPSQCGLAPEGRLPGVIALEAAAQTAAAWEALRRSREAGAAGARIGYLVAVRDVSFLTESIAADVAFTATVQLEAAALPLTHYAVEVVMRDEVVLRGRIATVLAEQAP
jgi:3-hydroxymyristoyl/3-hydroxydecanoyl-(acyl carrier protein) dehydratase